MSENILELLTAISFVVGIVGLLGLWSLKPMLSIQLDIAQKVYSETSDYTNQFILGITVRNSGALPIKYTVKSRREDLLSRGIDLFESELVILAPSTKTQSDNGENKLIYGALYNERIQRDLMPEDGNKSKREIPLYEHRHNLAAGESTSDGLHVFGNVALNTKNLDYDAGLRPTWETYVQVEPKGFWGLPFLRKINTRKMRLTSSSIMVRCVDKSF